MTKTPKEIAAIIQEMVNRIVKTVNPTQVILFGSHARGTAGPDSDVDLLVVIPGGSSKKKKVTQLHRVLAGVGLSKDVIVVTPEDIELDRNSPGTLIRPALLEGKVVYQRAA